MWAAMIVSTLLKRIYIAFTSTWRQICNERAARKTIHSISPRELSFHLYEGEQKPRKQIEEEIFNLWVHHKGSWGLQATINDYFMLSCDDASTNVDSYIFQEEFDGYRNKMNPAYAGIMNEKDHVALYLAHRGINATHPLGKVNQEGRFIDILTQEENDFITWYNNYGKPVFAKPINGKQGRGCFKLEKQGNSYLIDEQHVAEQELASAVSGHLLEIYIEQHPAFAHVHPQSLNDIRIVTARQGKEIFVYGAFARFGVDDMHVDNLHAGGIAVGVRPDGSTTGKGVIICGKKRGGYTVHPNSGVDFRQFTIPLWEECCKLACSAHNAFPFLHSCGWDVGITPNGPIIIEGNASWHSNLLQTWHGPARKEIHRYFPCAAQRSAE